VKVPKETFVQQERKECLPFEYTPEQVEAMHNYDPCAGYQVIEKYITSMPVNG